MKTFALFCIALLAFGLVESCSDSPAPANNYPLTLTLDSANQYGALLRFLSLRVTNKSGAPVKGAKLIETEENVYLSTYSIATSDSTGTFPTFEIDLDSVTDLAFQAMKDTVENGVTDTLTSNQVIYP